MTTNERTLGRYLRWLLAALSVGAAFIHFAVSGGHYDVSWMHGTFFAVVAWLRIAFAVGVILRPTRRLLTAGVLLNAGIIGVWAVSRIWGVPVGPAASAGQISSAGGHGHRGPVQWQNISDRATRDQLGQQLDTAHQVTLTYPTVADAEAAGYHMVTAYVPCIGAHYIKVSNMIGGFDPAKPSMLLYDGTNPDSKIVGLSYSILGDPNKPPEGFAGPNDPWHKHDSNGGLCLKGAVVVGAESTSEAECTARGGKKTALHNLWMMHAWTADAWQSSWGIFSAENPDLGGKLGDINATPDAASRKQPGNTANRD